MESRKNRDDANRGCIPAPPRESAPARDNLHTGPVPQWFPRSPQASEYREIKSDQIRTTSWHSIFLIHDLAHRLIATRGIKCNSRRGSIHLTDSTQSSAHHITTDRDQKNHATLTLGTSTAVCWLTVTSYVKMCYDISPPRHTRFTHAFHPLASPCARKKHLQIRSPIDRIPDRHFGDR